MNAAKELFGETIYSYTRAEAIEDGVLADLTETAGEAGIKFPVAITEAAYKTVIEVPQGCDGIQDVSGRTWDVLMMLRNEIKRSLGSSSIVFFKVSVVTGRGKRETVELKAVCGPGDKGEPVITIMFPNED